MHINNIVNCFLKRLSLQFFLYSSPLPQAHHSINQTFRCKQANYAWCLQYQRAPLSKTFIQPALWTGCSIQWQLLKLITSFVAFLLSSSDNHLWSDSGSWIVIINFEKVAYRLIKVEMVYCWRKPFHRHCNDKSW